MNSTDIQNHNIVLFSKGNICYDGASFSGIYGILNNITGKWYIGQSKNVPRRTMEYLNMKIKSGQKLIYRALKKYGIQNFTCYKLEECKLNELSERELYWGSKLNSMCPTGYNLSLGGQGNKIISEETRLKMSKSSIGHKRNMGHKHSEETKEKMSLSAKLVLTPERIEKMRIANIGNQHWKLIPIEKLARTEETKQKIREKAIGRKASKETRLKMSNSRKLRTIIQWLEKEAPWFVPQKLEEIK